MAKINIASNVPIASLNADITNVAISLDVGAGEGATFPTAPFVIGVEEEAMLVTVVATDTFTVTRGYAGTSAVAHTIPQDVTHSIVHENVLPRDDTSGSYLLESDLDANGMNVATLSDIGDIFISGIASGQGIALASGGTQEAVTVTSSMLSASNTDEGSLAGMVDGNSGSYWQITGVGVEEWFQIDFGVATQLDEFTWEQHAASGTPDFRIDVSDDATNWTTVQTWSGQLHNVTLGFAQTYAQYWRWVEERAGSFNWRVYELVVRNTPSAQYGPFSRGLKDNAGIFEAQGHVDMSGFSLAVDAVSQLPLNKLSDVSLAGFIDQTTVLWSADGYNGLMDWLGKDKGTTTWAHPENTRGYVTTANSATNSTDTSDKAFDQLSTTVNRIATTNVANSWWEMDLGADNKIKPTRFAIKGQESAGDHPRIFYIEGKEDAGGSYVTLLDVDGTTVVSTVGDGTFDSWALLTQTYYRYFRVYQYGNNSSARSYLVLGEVELYGSYADNANRIAVSGDSLILDGSNWVPQNSHPFANRFMLGGM